MQENDNEKQPIKVVRKKKSTVVEGGC